MRSCSDAIGRGPCGPCWPAGAALIAIVVATSRALLGVHWVSDVVAGLALGWGWFLLVAVVFGGRTQRLGDPVSDTKHEQQATERNVHVREKVDA